MPKVLTEAQLTAIADALGDTSDGLTGSEIHHLLLSARIIDVDPPATKRIRIFNAFVYCQNNTQDRRYILSFIRRAMKPELYARNPERYEPMRAKLNRALAFCGMVVTEAGELASSEWATTLTQAQRRADELRTDLEIRKVHPDILMFCREELLKDNYFHAIFEATKSVAEKLRSKTGLTDDGGTLVDRALSGNIPLWAINPLTTESERSEQKGFANVVKGVFGMYRNTTAHVPKINWVVNREDAEEAFTILSMIHKRIDAGRMPPRT